ncbi:cadherin domain-containing protein [Granulosicoccus sp. 3-233]|uniref:cadherin domain-containing protein n=1 Tax=Granulosicoccus sp. 3-233 TaxID=3417969 RepID=UPI003D332CB3
MKDKLNNRPQRQNDAFRLEALEPRLLFSADAASLFATTDILAAHETSAGNLLSTVESQAANSASTSALEHSESPAVELVIIDRGVDNAEWIAQQLSVENDSERAVHFIDSQSDGVDQISSVLDQYQNVTSVRLFSHGGDARLQLGNTTLDMNELLQRAEQVNQWSTSLSQGADILIYGCDLASSVEGQAFTSLFGELTQADIAASDDLSGNAALGGDWSLEFRAGLIDTETDTTAIALQDYASVLGEIMVKNLDDSGTDSLREAIEEANLDGGPNTIVFEVTGTIQLTTALPGITSQLDIDGENNIVLDGSAIGSGSAVGLSLVAGSDNSTISNLQIIHFPSHGISLTDTDNVTLIHNFIGTDGTDNYGNSGHGIENRNSSNTAIGDGTLAGSNVIAGNGNHGILLTGAGSTNVSVNYNFIGTNNSGTAAIANGQNGIYIIDHASGSQINANIISGNGSNGVSLTGFYTTYHQLTANRIGTTADGTGILGNADSGISLTSGTYGNSIGGSTAGSGNLVSGNGYDGVTISGSYTDSNDVLGNLIGTSLDGSNALANGRHGVQISNGAQDNFIGGSGLHERNIISGNTQTGITIDGNNGSTTTDNAVVGNYIGTDITGSISIPNVQHGIYVKRGASDNRIGGSNDNSGPYALAEGNVISGNGDFSDLLNPSGSGIRIENTTTDRNVIFGNFIGTQADGVSLLGNARNGIEIYYGPQNTLIGTGDITHANVISGNGFDGIKIDSYNAPTENNSIVGNRIGTDITASQSIGNGDSGIQLSNGSANNTIGGDRTAGEANIIVANKNGIRLGSTGSDNNTIVGNYIGTNSVDSTTLGNTQDGITLYGGASANRIGGSGIGQGNIISGNSDNGIRLNGSNTDGNVVQGNFIGTTVDGSGVIGNGGSGIRLVSGPGNSLIGGDRGAGEGNLISGNAYAGISFWGAGTDGHIIQGNRIGTTLDGNSALGSQSSGILITGGASNNTIGGLSTAGTGNLISGHASGYGISISLATSSDNIITGNLIGTNAAGDAPLANLTGIYIDDATNTRIGGSLPGEGNIIAGNSDIGLNLQGTTTSATVQGNLVGTNSAGSLTLGNGDYGIHVRDSTELVTIGGAAANEGNILSGNATYGLSINGTTNVVVKGNYIGVDASGFVAIGNDLGGIQLSGAASNTQIGGSGNGDGNLISGNAGSGITLSNNADGNTISGNLIGLAVDGITLLGNLGYGIAINTSNNRIGGNTSSERNIISGNTSHGIAILSAADQNTLIGNRIGTDASDTIDLGNNGHGIWLESDNNQLGGTLPGSGNVIAFNIGNGIRVEGGATGNAMLGNAIRDNGGIGIDLDGDAVTDNDADDSDSGANNLQNFPVLANVIVGESGELSIDSEIRSSTNTTFRVEFFASSTADASGHGDAQRMIGYTTMTTDAGGSATTQVILDANVAAGEYVTATATVDNGSGGFSDTSEFAANVIAVSHATVNSAPDFHAGEGFHTVALANLYNGAVDLVTQPDGKYLVLSAVNTAASGKDLDFALTRFNADGSLDTGFGNGGTIISALTSNNETVSALSLQGDGKIILAGARSLGNANEAVMIRYNSDGSLDTTFGSAGVAAFSLAGTTSSVITDIDLMTDGRIVASGHVKVAGVDAMLALRATSDGNLDSSFNGTGYRIIDTGIGDAEAGALQVQTDGKVVLAGYRDNGTTTEARIVRLTVDGALDNTLSGDGHIILVSGDNLQATTLEIAADGKIVVGGNSDAADYPSQISRFLTDGSLDSSFGGTGYVIVNVGSPFESVNKLTIQQDGRIVVAGNGYNGSNNDVSVFRLNTDGSLDTSFNSNGMARFDISGATDSATAVDIDAMGNIMVAGNSDGNMFIASIRDNGTLNGQFNARNTLDATPAYTEDTAPVVLDADVQVFDRELSEADNFSGASLVLERDSLANADDIFGFTTANGLSLSGNQIIKGGQVIGIFDANSTPGQLTLTFTDANGEIPTNADVNHALQQITYQNSNDNPPGSVQINWTLKDGNAGAQGSGGDLSAAGQTTVSITASNDAPVITSDGGTVFASIVVNEGDIDVTEVTASDVDIGAVLTYGIRPFVDHDSFSIDPVTGQLSFNNPPDHETQSEYQVWVEVTDNEGATDTQIIDISVVDINEQPVFLTPATLPDADEDAAYSVNIDTSDPDSGDTRTFSATDLPSWLTMQDNLDGTATLSGTPLQGDIGPVSFTLDIEDAAGLKSTRTFSLNVQNVNDPTVLTSPSSFTVSENSTVAAQITSTDEDGDDPEYAINGGSDASLFSIDAATGELSFNSAADFENPLDADGNNVHEVIVSVTDNAGPPYFATSQVITVTVTDTADEDLSPIIDQDALAGDQGIIDENSAIGSTVGITAHSTDGDAGQTVSYALSGTDAALFSIDANGVVTTAAALDHEEADTRSFIVTATSSDGSTTTRGFTVSVTDLADEDLSPIIDQDALAGDQGIIDENSAIGSTVGITAHSTDGDAGQTVSYALSGTDAALFSIDANGVVTTAAALDHEEAGSRSFIVTATSSDGSTATRGFTVSVTDLADEDLSPIIDQDALAGDQGIIDENSAIGSTVGITAHSTDGDAGQTVSYALSGTDAALFSIDANGVVTTAAALDHEEAGSRSFIVTATSSDGSTTTRGFTVSVTDLADEDLSPIIDQDATTGSNGSDGIIDENSAIGSTVGINAHSADGDAGQTVSYALSGTDAALFSIDANGVVTTAAALDHEEADTRSFIVTATSSDGSTATRGFTVSVTDLADEDLSPIIDQDALAGDQGIIDENSAIGSTVGITAHSSDGDAGQTVSYALSGTDAALFSIDANGVVTTAAALDHEEAGSRSFIVTATSSDGSTTTRGFTVSVTDLADEDLSPIIDQDATTGSNGSDGIIDENSAIGSTVGINAHSADGDAGQTVSYALSGTDAALFTIDANGVITTAAALDHEEADTRSFIVTATSSDGSTASRNFIVTVGNVNEAPVFTSNSTLPDATEDSYYTTTISTRDPDTGDSLSFNNTAMPNWLSLIDNNDGTATLSGTPQNNHVGSHSITLEIEDAGGLKSTRTFTVTVSNVNDAPVFTSGNTFTITENASDIASISANDADGNSLSYAIAGGADAALFTIDATTGELSFSAAPDYENPRDADLDQVHELIVSADDGTASPDSITTQAITVSVTDLADEDLSPIIDQDATTGSNGSDGIVDENSSIGSTVGITAHSTDGDAGQTVSYALSGTDAALFSIDANGVVTTTAALDHEEADTRSFIVTATSSDGSTATREFTVSVTDLPDEDLSPIIDQDATTGSNGSDGIVDENSAIGSTVGITAHSSDGDAGQTVSYALSGTDAGLFSIDANGVITTAAALDHEEADTRSFIVTATSTDGSTAIREFTVSVTDLPDEDLSPIIDQDATTGSNGSDGIVDENSSIGSTVSITAHSTDGDAGQTVSYALSGTDAALFSIDANGVVTTAAALDHEEADTRSFIVTATSTDGSTATRGFTVSVTDLPDEDLSPIIDQDATTGSNGSDGIVDENSAIGSTVGITAHSSDGDAGQTVSYALSGTDAGLFSIDANGVITTAAALDHEEAGTRSFIITATSTDGSTAIREFTVSVTDLPDEDLSPIIDQDATTGSNGSDGIVDENSSIGSTVSITAHSTDGDAGQTVSYALSGTDAALFSIDANGVVTTAAALDHEEADTRSFIVTATSTDGSTATRGFTVSVTDLPDEDLSPIIDQDATTGSNGSDGIVDENSAIGSTVGITAHSSDGDAGQTVSYALSGTDAALFSIDANGVVTTAAALDHEEADTRSFIVTATSSDGSTAMRGFSVSVSDINEAPVHVTDTTLPDATEDSRYSVIINSHDPDQGDSHSFHSPDLPDWLTMVDNGDGTATLTGTPQQADNGSATFNVEITDAAGLKSNRSFLLTVNNVNNAPVIDSENSFTVAENSVVITTVTASDADGDALTYAIIGGSDAAMFTIDPVSGTLAFSTAPDYENPDDANGDRVHELTISVDDGSGSDNAVITRTIFVTISDLPDEDLSPVTDLDNTAGQAGFVMENSVIGTAVGITAHSEDGDAGQTVSYTLGGPDAAAFQIDSEGVITTTIPLDHEAGNELAFIVNATSSDGSTATRSFTVAVGDIDESPTITSADNISITENRTLAGIITAIDINGNTPTISITGGEDAGLFSLDPDSGELRFRNNPDFEVPQDHDKDNRYELELTATDSLNQSTTQTQTVTVTNLNEAPSINIREIQSTPEHNGDIGTLSIVDPDSGDIVELTIVGGNAASSFHYDNATAQLSQIAHLDTGRYTLEVMLVDSAGNATQATLTISILDDPRLQAALPESTVDMDILAELETTLSESMESTYSSLPVPGKITPSDTEYHVQEKPAEPDSAADEVVEQSETTTPVGDHFHDPKFDMAPDLVSMALDNPNIVNPVSSLSASGYGNESSEKTRLLEIMSDLQKRGLMSPQSIMEKFQILPFQLTLAPSMLDGSDTLTQDLSETAKEQNQQQQLVVAIGTGASVALTAGFVSWLLKAGVLISTAKSSAPLWSAIDPVPVLQKRNDS